VYICLFSTRFHLCVASVVHSSYLHCKFIYYIFVLIGHLQAYKLVLQGGSYKATATPAVSLLGWYCSEAMHVFSFTVLLVDFFFLFRYVEVLDVFVCYIRCTLLGGRSSCLFVVSRVRLMQQTNTSKTATHRSKRKFDYQNHKPEHVHGCSAIPT
jgi:hypothetical protein